jgi:hypothetical protein
LQPLSAPAAEGVVGRLFLHPDEPRAASEFPAISSCQRYAVDVQRLALATEGPDRHAEQLGALVSEVDRAALVSQEPAYFGVGERKVPPWAVIHKPRRGRGPLENLGAIGPARNVLLVAAGYCPN